MKAVVISNDRELTELAANAAGYEIEFVAAVEGYFARGHDNNGDVIDWWNPLTDDGDALRLAAKLNIDITYSATPNGPMVECRHEWGEGLVVVSEELDKPAQAAAAVRRAIVRAAAELTA